MPGPPPYDGAAYAKQVQRVVLEGLVSADGYSSAKAFTDTCPAIAWACAIDTVESRAPHSVRVTLRPEQDWITLWHGSNDWHDFGEQVARGVRNFAQAGGVTALRQVDVYQADGELAYLSPAQ